MSKKTDEASSPRPDEPRPERPMQPVFERAPEPDPANRNTRPELTTPTTRADKLHEQQDKEYERQKQARKAQQKSA